CGALQRSAQRAGMQQQGLRARLLSQAGRPAGMQSLGVDFADRIQLRGGKIGLRTRTLIGREGVGERACIGLPDAALDADGAGECDLNQCRELLLQPIVDLPAGPTGTEELVAVGDVPAGPPYEL